MRATPGLVKKPPVLLLNEEWQVLQFLNSPLGTWVLKSDSQFSNMLRRELERPYFFFFVWSYAEEKQKGKFQIGWQYQKCEDWGSPGHCFSNETDAFLWSTLFFVPPPIGFIQSSKAPAPVGIVVKDIRGTDIFKNLVQFNKYLR